MAVTVETLQPKPPAANTGGGGLPGQRDWSGGGSGDDGYDGRHKQRPPLPRRTYFTALWLGQAGIFMFFMSLASSYVVRRGIAGDWQDLGIPWGLWVSTFVLLLSSVTLEKARRAITKADKAGFSLWWGVSTLLGFGFVGAQLFAWWQLAGRHIFLATNPSSSFFYVFTALHALHVLAGLIALVYVWWPSVRANVGPGARLAPDLATLYWHFLDGLWILLFVLLFIGGGGLN